MIHFTFKLWKNNWTQLRKLKFGSKWNYPEKNPSDINRFSKLKKIYIIEILNNTKQGGCQGIHSKARY